jgi:PKD repeat protein
MMKKFIIFKMISLLIIFSAYAGPVDVNTAKNVAKNFYYEVLPDSKNLTYNEVKPELVYTCTEGTIPIYYVFNVNQNDGFVIISADDDAFPTLGCSFTGEYIEGSEQPPNFVDWMNNYKEQILFVKNNGLQADETIEQAWIEYNSNYPSVDGVLGVNPLLTTTWNQGCYYNELCPVDYAGPCDHVYAGCVATAMGQVMKYHNHPEQGTGSHSYYTASYGTLSANFGATTYDWASMPNNISYNNVAVATLLYHCGVSVDMDYSPSGSGAWTSDTRTALINYFSYSSSAQYKQRSNYSSVAWENLLKVELEASRPMIYRGQGSGGHAFVCDGYQGTNHFHFNWGWSGSYNGYFYLTNLNPGGSNFTDYQAAVIGIQPEVLAPTADFTSNITTVEEGGSVSFTDLSTGSITSRSWSFAGGSPSSSTQENPTIVYNTPGSYTVSLTVTGPGGSNTEVKTNYITVTSVSPENHFDFEGGDPSSPIWTIYISNCELEGEDLQAGDEIAIFDGETMVGAFVFTQVCTPDNQFNNDLIAFSEITSGSGYQAGNSFTLKVWDASENIESISFEYIFSNPYGDAYTGDVFPSGDGQYSLANLDFGLFPDPHFIFEGGDPSSPIWTIYLGGGTFEGVDLVPGDEIAIFDGDVMVGAFILDQVMTMDNLFENDLIAFSVLTSQPGYQAGNAYSFKCWDASQELEIEYFDIELFDPYGGAYMGDVFPTGDAHYSIATIDFNMIPDPHFVFGGGNPADPIWTIYLSSATFDNLDLQPYDELAIFDGEVMVGAIRLTQVCTPENQFENTFIAWSTLSSGDPGYTVGNDIILKCWDASEEVEGVYFDIEFSDPYGDAWTEPTFPPGDGQYSLADVSYYSGGVISGTVILNGGPGVVTDVVVTADGVSVNPNSYGFYQIINLEAGSFEVSATLDAYYPESETVEVVIGEITTVDFTLNPEVGTISGTVIDELTLLPIEGVLITVGGGAYETFTSVDGTYVIPDVLIGVYEVSAEIINYYPETISDVEVIVDVTTTIDFALMPEPGEISGTVTLNGGPGDVLDVEININGTIISPNSSGYYELGGLNPGTYEVYFSLDAYYPEIVNGVIVISNDLTTVDVTLNPEVGNIAGTITDYVTGEPIEGVQVSLEGFYIVSTDALGYYLFENLLIGTYNLSVEFDGYYPEEVTDIVVITDETTEVDFALHPIHFPFAGGNPADPVWTIYLAGGTLDGLDLQIMDEIAIFDGETLVGAFTLTEVLTPENQFNNVLIAWSTLSNGDTGYTPGNPVDLKCWDASEGIETVNVDITFHNPYGDAYVGEVFPTGDGQYSIVDLDFVTTITQSYSLSYGYQFVSTRVIPENPNMQVVCTELLDNLDFVRNTAGLMLRKIGPVWVNSIGDWVTTEGYLVRMNDADNFEIEGMEIDPQTPIDLAYGYQFISFLPEEPMDAQFAFTDILDNLDFVRNTAGYMLRKIGPVWVNGIGNLNPNEGYLLRMNAPDVQIYPVADKKFTGVSKIETEYFDFEGGNAADPIFTLYVEGLEIGDEIAAYNENVMVGAVKINSQNVFENELPLFSTLNNGQGYMPGKSISLKVWNYSAQQIIPVEFVINDTYSDAYTEDVYPSDDGLFSVVKISKDAIENSEALSVFPNPADEILNILSANEIKSIVIFNSFGQKVFEGNVNNTNTKIHTGNFESGVYVIRIETLNGIETRKISIQ